MLPALVCRHARCRVQNLASVTSLWQLPMLGDREQDECQDPSTRKQAQYLWAGLPTSKPCQSTWSQLFPLRGLASLPQPESPETASSSGSEHPTSPVHPPLSQDVVYYGPLSETHKLLKRISIANTLVALAAAPAIVMFADASYVSRVGLAISLALFGITTTGALHWVTHPYVHELRYTAATQSFEAKMTSLFGGTRTQHFKLSEVEPLPWNRPVATFMANGQFYYIDVYSFPDEELLKRLTPSDVPAGYQDDKEDD